MVIKRQNVLAILFGITLCLIFILHDQSNDLKRLLQVDLTFPSTRFTEQKNELLGNKNSRISIELEEYNKLRTMQKELETLRNGGTTVDDTRICKENPYKASLSKSLEDIAIKADNWTKNENEILKDIQFRSNGEHNHIRFEAFEELATCNYDCVGGKCSADRSKIICGLSKLNDEKCVVYSIGSNNYWEFELEILEKTPCTVHTFDCTGPRSRFTVPNHERLHFHHVCLGAEPVPAPTELGPKIFNSTVIGEIMTLHQIQKMLNHKRIDLLKFDIEGYEWPLIDSWPLLSDPRSQDYVLPYQIVFELHYYTIMKDLALNHIAPFKFETDHMRLAARLIKLGYATIVRDNNVFCKHCTELTSIRFRCPEQSY